MSREKRKSSVEIQTGRVETRVRADGILYTKMQGSADDAGLADLKPQLERHLTGDGAVDWILDFTGITSSDGMTNGVLRQAFDHFKNKGGRQVVAIVNDGTRLLATSSCFGANLGATFVDDLERALLKIEERRKEDW